MPGLFRSRNTEKCMLSSEKPTLICWFTGAKCGKFRKRYAILLDVEKHDKDYREQETTRKGTGETEDGEMWEKYPFLRKNIEI